MIYFKYILLILNFIFCFTISDSLLSLRDTIDKKGVLIPDHDNSISKFKIEYLDKSKKLFFDSNISYISNYNAIGLSFYPLINYEKIKLKIDLEYFFFLDQDSLLSNNWSLVDIIEKIDYLKLKLLNQKLNIFLGEISDLSFGHGYLLNKYGNNYNYPLDRNIGFKLELKNSNSSIIYKSFISNIEEFFKSGSMLGNHISILVSDNFPLRLGFGHVIDLDQFIGYKDYINQSRKINAFEIDFDIPLSNKNIFLIGEISTIKLPETRYYKRVDDNQFTDDKKIRNAIWGILFPGFKYMVNDYSILLGFNYNSSIFSPHYFNSSYDFERIRYRLYNINQNEENFSDEAELLMNFVSDSSFTGLFIPKDLYSMINGYENTYPSYGISMLFNKKINDFNYFNIEYSYFKELAIEGLSFNNLLVDFFINKSLFSFPIEFNLFFNKSFFESSSLSSLEENLMYGLKFKINIYENLFFSTELKDVFYDRDFDGQIDKISYINTGFKLKF